MWRLAALCLTAAFLCGCAGPTIGEHVQIDTASLQLKHVLLTHWEDRHFALGAQTGFPISARWIITSQHDIERTARMFVESTEVEAAASSHHDDRWWNDWLTLVAPEPCIAPTISREQLQPGEKVYIVGFPGQIEAGSPKEAKSVFLSRKPTVVECEVVRNPWPEQFPDEEVIIARTDYEGVLKGLSGGPAVVLRDGRQVVVGLCFAGFPVGPFGRIFTDGLRTWRAVVLRKIPKHLLDEQPTPDAE